MKNIFLFFIFLFAGQYVFADQFYVLTYKEAIMGKRLLDNQEKVILFCACCDNVPKTLVTINKVTIEKWDGYYKNEDYYFIKIHGKGIDGSLISEGVDLAYVHILKDDGLAYNVAGELLWDVEPCTAPFPYKDIEKYSTNDYSKNNDSTNDQMTEFENFFGEYEKIIKKGELNSIFINEKRYPAIQPLYFEQATSYHYSNTEEDDLEISFTIGKKDNSSGIILLQKTNSGFFATFSRLSFQGDLLIYLENGDVIKCIDRKIYGYTDDTASIIYYLTKAEIEKLLKNKIVEISYALTEQYVNQVYKFSAQFLDSNEDYRMELSILFK
ncbi:MAG: hypothetical protein H3C39_03655 [Flavobacteriia bacterium]|nr:hypothetical protein [Flavobacteriia bacterium]